MRVHVRKIESRKVKNGCPSPLLALPILLAPVNSLSSYSKNLYQLTDSLQSICACRHEPKKNAHVPVPCQTLFQRRGFSNPILRLNIPPNICLPSCVPSLPAPQIHLLDSFCTIFQYKSPSFSYRALGSNMTNHSSASCEITQRCPPTF